MENEKKIIGAYELAAICRMPVTWIRQKCREGKIPHVRMADGHILRFHRKTAMRAVERLVAEGGGDGQA